VLNGRFEAAAVFRPLKKVPICRFFSSYSPVNSPAPASVGPPDLAGPPRTASNLSPEPVPK
jgi:hypothetical protein